VADVTTSDQVTFLPKTHRRTVGEAAVVFVCRRCRSDHRHDLGAMGKLLGQGELAVLDTWDNERDVPAAELD
jgi:hypothetical protein